MRARNKESIGILGCCWLAAAGLLAGCSINDYGTCPPDGGDGRYSLRIQMMVPNAGIGTRASDHKEEPGSEAENFIDINDLRILIYDGEDGSLAMEIDQAKLEEGHVPSDTYTSYFIKVGPIDPDWIPNKLESFRIMVLANWNSFDRSAKNTRYPFSGTSISAESPYSIYKNDQDFNFTMPQSRNESTWVPSKSDGRHIPMFGISDELSINAADSDASSDGPTIDAGSISMLRSIAKVEIIDEMEGQDITGVTLSRSNASGRFIPDITLDGNVNWDKKADGSGSIAQLSVPSLPAIYKDGTAAADDYITDLSLFVQETDSHGKSIWAAYIPEMTFPESESRPVFTVGYKNTSTANSKSFNFNNFVDGKEVSGNSVLKSVLRNHIYKYYVKVNDDSNLTIDLEVLPWDLISNEDSPWNFDIPEFAKDENGKGKYLSWVTEEKNPDYEEGGNEPEYIPNGYKDYFPEKLMLMMKPGTDDFAEGRMHLIKPVGAKWYATLISLNQDHHDSFKFVDENGEDMKDADGNVVNYAYGTIDGTEQVIRIKNIYEKVSEERNESRLSFTIEYPDKTQKEVYVVEPGSNGSNYTIVQEITEII